MEKDDNEIFKFYEENKDVFAGIFRESADGVSR